MNLLEAITENDDYKSWKNADAKRTLLATVKKMEFDGNELKTKLTAKEQTLVAGNLVKYLGVLTYNDGKFFLVDGIEAPEVVIEQSKAQDSTKKAPVKTGVETREPRDQNEYNLCVVNSKQLKANSKLAVLIASVEFGLEGFKKGQKFSDVKKELTAEFMAGKMNVSHDVARRAMTEATKLGFLERLDNGKGGRNSKNKATYRPKLPSYF